MIKKPQSLRVDLKNLKRLRKLHLTIQKIIQIY